MAAEVYEGSLLCAHEAAHGLINLVFLGNPGTIELSAHGGTCSSYWDPALKLDDSDAALLLYKAHSALAGAEGERLLHDYAGLDSSQDSIEAAVYLKHLGIEGITVRKDEVVQVVQSLLRQHRRPLKTLAAELGGTTGNARNKQALLRNDHEHILLGYSERPVLARGGWYRHWTLMRHQAAHDLTFNPWAGEPDRRPTGVLDVSQRRRLA
jgi:hypothetical protein